MTLEEKAEAAVPWSVYWRYFAAGGFVTTTLSLLLVSHVLSQVAQIGSQFWLAVWSSDTKYAHFTLGLYMGVFVLIGVGAGEARVCHPFFVRLYQSAMYLVL